MKTGTDVKTIIPELAKALLTNKGNGESTPVLEKRLEAPEIPTFNVLGASDKELWEHPDIDDDVEDVDTPVLSPVDSQLHDQSRS